MVYRRENTISRARAIELLSAENTPYQLLMWNACYGGGPNLSGEAVEAYNEYLTRQGAPVDHGQPTTPNLHFLQFLQHFQSEDPNRRFADRYSAYAFALIKKEQAPFYKLKEYDGLETPYMETQKYILHKIDVHYQQKDTMSQTEYADYSRIEHERLDIEG